MAQCRRYKSCVTQSASDMVTPRIPRVLQVGTDFSGLDSAWIALQRLQLPCRLCFCSDTEPACRAFLQRHGPGQVFEDISSRTPEQEVYCDVYVTTPPCQTYSSAGKRKGTQDERGKLVHFSLKYIQRHRPRLVIMENVKGLKQKKFRPVLLGIHAALKKLGYVMWTRVLDSADFRVPQKRRRLFLVAIRQDSRRSPFKWPKPLGTRRLEEVLDPWNKATDKAGRLPTGERACKLAKLAYKKIYAKGVNPIHTPCAVDIGCTEKWLTWGVNISRTLCRGRAASGGFWLSSRGRKTTLTEMMRISGFDPGELSGHVDAGIANTNLQKMLGNTVPVPLIGEVLQSGLVAAGLLASRKPFPTP